MKMKFYKCKHCGQIIAMIEPTGVPVICCGEPMEEMVANTQDASAEKHVPDYKCESGKCNVNIGTSDHPMADEHYIKWIVVETDKGNYLKVLEPGQKPCKSFNLCEDEKPCNVYAYCNIHGLWKK